MHLLKGALYLAIILIVFSCKKQSISESEYVVERDNSQGQTIRTATAMITPVITYQPTIADSITAIFVCEKGRYFTVNGVGVRNFMNSFYYYDAALPLSFDSLIKRIPAKMPANMIQFALGDSSDISITYPKGNTIIHSTKGYPNYILDQFPFSCGSCFYLENEATPYKIRFNGSNYNTDKIFSHGNGYYGIIEADIILKPYSCSSGKRCSFSICFDNYSYFKINGKWFVWINRISDFGEAGR